MKVGIVGASRGGGYIAAIRAAGDRAVLQGVYDPAPEASLAFNREYGAQQLFTSFEEAVDICDILVIASPQQYHAPQAAYALQAGVHVLSEVPAAVSMEQVNILLAAARSSSRVYMMSENYGYTRNNLIVRAMAREGMFGELYMGEAEYVHEMKAFHTSPSGDPTWRYYWQVGRNGVTYPTHSLGPLLDWMDDRIESVSCVGTGRWTDPEHEMDDSVTLLARTRKGGLIRTRLDLLSNRPELWDFYSVQGTGGAYESGRGMGDLPRVYLHGRSAPESWEPLEAYAERFLPDGYANPPAGSGHWGSDAWPFLEFLTAVEQGTPAPIDVYKALEMTLPGIVSEESIASGGAWLRVPQPRTMTAGIGINPGLEAPLA
ncbi:Gfo/Idh/MocA family protein [Sinomonas terrae]|uniref:Gfo/Idh/MocA family oxidoreductase n=1 Tax=Sinomonas terrae TaxID=2908838 RepID=A0ABS9U782_9MICC|nr:Gfo/Idh/MocA family oxidoreductase [Sinomonas terrae]MCH6472544.1 Gfo/Idh/MocA family oxidoreductase [Sinomonas terrae]